MTTTALFLAAGGLDDALSKGGLIIFKIAFLLTTILIMGAGLAVRGNDNDSAKKGIIGAIIVASAGLIAEAIFGAAGMQSAVIKIGSVSLSPLIAGQFSYFTR
jgi:hypothetical protein